jgi:hypothetical protein
MRIPPPKKRIDTVRFEFPRTIHGNPFKNLSKPTPTVHSNTT